MNATARAFWAKMYEICLPQGGTPQNWSILEMQGTLQFQREDMSGHPLGKLSLRPTVRTLFPFVTVLCVVCPTGCCLQDGRPVLELATSKLVGTQKTFSQPLLVLQRKHDPENSSKRQFVANAVIREALVSAATPLKRTLHMHTG